MFTKLVVTFVNLSVLRVSPGCRSSLQRAHMHIVKIRRESRSVHRDQTDLCRWAERMGPRSAALPVYAVMTGVGRVGLPAGRIRSFCNSQVRRV